MTNKLKITQVRSTIKRKEDQKRTIEALGIHRLNHTVILPDVPQIRGMIHKVKHLLQVEEIKS
jgi:large subunit ribosomal protein L30